MTQEDRYEHIARSLEYVGWIQDLMLRRARMKAVSLLQSMGARSVLDACCGAGTLTRYLCSAGMNVTAVDLSPSMLHMARKKAPDATFLQADVTGLPLENTFDGSVIALSLHEMSEQSRVAVWQSMRRYTRQEGILILIDYTQVAHPSLASRIAEWVIWKDEESIGKDDPPHFEHFREFMSIGGASGWLAGKQQPVSLADACLFGNLGVFAVQRAPD